MIWYKHFIGAFQSKTGHLSLMERGAYHALLEHYYSTEEPLPMDRTTLYRIAGAQTPAEQKSVVKVLDFFEEFEGRLWNRKADEQITKYSALSAKNKSIAIERERLKRLKVTSTKRDTSGSTLRAASGERNVAPQDHEYQKIEKSFNSNSAVGTQKINGGAHEA